MIHWIFRADDGSIRLYKLPDTKVVQAVRGLDDTVSGIVFGSSEGNAVFAAAGHSVSDVCRTSSGAGADMSIAQIFQFSLDTSKLILNREDALSAVDAREESTEDDALNNVRTVSAWRCEVG